MIKKYCNNNNDYFSPKFLVLDDHAYTFHAKNIEIEIRWDQYEEKETKFSFLLWFKVPNIKNFSSFSLLNITPVDHQENEKNRIELTIDHKNLFLITPESSDIFLIDKNLPENKWILATVLFSTMEDKHIDCLIYFDSYLITSKTISIKNSASYFSQKKLILCSGFMNYDNNGETSIFIGPLHIFSNVFSKEEQENYYLMQNQKGELIPSKNLNKDLLNMDYFNKNRCKVIFPQKMKRKSLSIIQTKKINSHLIFKSTFSSLFLSKNKQTQTKQLYAINEKSNINWISNIKINFHPNFSPLFFTKNFKFSIITKSPLILSETRKISFLLQILEQTSSLTVLTSIIQHLSRKFEETHELLDSSVCNRNIINLLQKILQKTKKIDFNIISTLLFSLFSRKYAENGCLLVNLDNFQLAVMNEEFFRKVVSKELFLKQLWEKILESNFFWNVNLLFLKKCGFFEFVLDMLVEGVFLNFEIHHFSFLRKVLMKLEGDQTMGEEIVQILMDSYRISLEKCKVEGEFSVETEIFRVKSLDAICFSLGTDFNAKVSYRELLEYHFLGIFIDFLERKDQSFSKKLSMGFIMEIMWMRNTQSDNINQMITNKLIQLFCLCLKHEGNQTYFIENGEKNLIPYATLIELHFAIVSSIVEQEKEYLKHIDFFDFLQISMEKKFSYSNKKKEKFELNKKKLDIILVILRLITHAITKLNFNIRLNVSFIFGKSNERSLSSDSNKEKYKRISSFNRQTDQETKQIFFKIRFLVDYLGNLLIKSDDLCNKDYAKSFLDVYLEIEENYSFDIKLHEYKLSLFSFIFSEQIFLTDPSTLESNLNSIKESLLRKEKFAHLIKAILTQTFKKIRRIRKIQQDKEKPDEKLIATNLSLITKKIISLSSSELNEWCLETFISFLNKAYYHKKNASNLKGSYFNKLLSKIGINENSDKKSQLSKETHLLIKRLFIHQLYLFSEANDLLSLNKLTLFLTENQKIVFLGSQENNDFSSAFFFILLTLPQKSFLEFLPIFLSNTSKEIVKKINFISEPNLTSNFIEILYGKPELIVDQACLHILRKKLEVNFNNFVMGGSGLEKRSGSMIEEEERKKKREKLVNERILSYKENGLIIGEEYEMRRGQRENEGRLEEKSYVKFVKGLKRKKKRTVFKLMNIVDSNYQRKLIRVKEIDDASPLVISSPVSSINQSTLVSSWSPSQFKKGFKINEVNSTNESSIHFSVHEDEAIPSNSLENLRLNLKIQGVIQKKVIIEHQFSFMMLHKHSLKYCVLVFTKKKVKLQ